MAAAFHESPIDKSTILKPFTHLYNDSKEPQMLSFIQAMNQLIKAPQEAVEIVSEVMCIVERSLCLTDDIYDDSKFRANIPTAHLVFGVPHSLAASWYSMFMAFEKLFALKQPKAVELLVKNLRISLEGQIMELLWRDSFQCPTEEESRQMTMLKTGNYLCLYTDLLQHFAQDERDLTRLLNLLGRYIQARDDMDDIWPKEAGSYNEDLNEGKFGFPLVIAINHHPEKLDKSEVAAKMADKTTRGSYIQSLLKESNALVRCEKIISELEAEIRVELNALGASEIFDSLMKCRFDS